MVVIRFSAMGNGSIKATGVEENNCLASVNKVPALDTKALRWATNHTPTVHPNVSKVLFSTRENLTGLSL